MKIRKEKDGDVSQIRSLTKAAFESVDNSEKNEHMIIDGLRANTALYLSLVVEIDGFIVAHLAISPITVSDNSSGWFGLGPVSVLPDHQNMGIGTMLISEALDILDTDGAQGCVVLGEPDYYARFGFVSSDDLLLVNVPAEYFQSIRLNATVLPKGHVLYNKAFYEY